jgi:hypothetical protein
MAAPLSDAIADPHIPLPGQTIGADEIRAEVFQSVGCREAARDVSGIVASLTSPPRTSCSRVAVTFPHPYLSFFQFAALKRATLRADS